jgi:hypothetical protein
MRVVSQAVLGLALLLATAGATLAAGAAGEPDIAGLWRGSIYGSDLQAQVEQDEHTVKAEVVIHALTGETNVYHVIGVLVKGHLVLIHGSGHVFEGDATPGEISGVLTTKGGTKVEVKASRVPPASSGQGSQGAIPSNRRPG